MKILHSFVMLAAVLVSAGCASFRCTQTDSFIDDLGNVAHVEYGNLTRPYKFTMVSPANGATITGESTKFVRIELPDGEWIDCRYCQNPFSYGTMYATTDGKWRYFTTGLECAIYLQTPDKLDYLLVFKGTAFQDERSGAGSTK